jgi:hypothetical protein
MTGIRATAFGSKRGRPLAMKASSGLPGYSCRNFVAVQVGGYFAAPPLKLFER